MFNGHDISNWVPKFSANMALGVNPDNTFRVDSGYLFVDNHLDYSLTHYGHLFFKAKPFKYFMVRAEYRFVGKTNAPNFDFGWNIQNNGLMIMGQTPESMGLSQDYPNSIEVQLLGPVHSRTANVCTPGTFIAYQGNNNYTQHCTDATYPAAWNGTKIPWEGPGGWADVTARVLSDSLLQHFIHGAKVFEYSKPRLDNGTPITEGSISIQAEGASTEFRKIEYLDLTGCMDESKPAYRTYFVKSDPAACNVTKANAVAEARDFSLAREAGSLRIRGTGAYLDEVRRLDGSLAAGFAAGSKATLFAPREPGLYLVSVKTATGSAQRKVALF